jgi:urease alpha subunit
MRMTPEEVISASTLNGAAALGLSNMVGSIEVGKAADLAIFSIPNYRYVPYHFGVNLASKVSRRVLSWSSRSPNERSAFPPQPLHSSPSPCREKGRLGGEEGVQPSLKGQILKSFLTENETNR